jgi:aspartokinase
MELKMLKHALANVVVKGNPKSHRVLVNVLGSLGKAGISIYGIMLEKDKLKFYVKETEYERALKILDKVAKGDVEFYVTRGIGMITISGGERGHPIDIDVLLAPVRDRVKIFDLIRSDNSVQLFLDLKHRGFVFHQLVKKVTDGFRVTKA